ncbi:hypothetical protein TNIN_198731 [Trichonephila inaurata madagascariensis]|uniref:Uncharacterized protein n=1 Tax=Trichonephila inaurata madagascariensis TaxID=2747483 RepID=A0A8X7CML7_9ARAC|nr:hypothetical protein TNIN_198731 [Trichonephila inaurata madagascariensis]
MDWGGGKVPRAKRRTKGVLRMTFGDVVSLLFVFVVCKANSEARMDSCSSVRHTVGGWGKIPVVILRVD